jgi:hypothetical protein
VRLTSGVGVRIAHCELIDVFFAIKTKCEGENIMVLMFWRTIIVDIFVWYPLPAKKKIKEKTFFRGKVCVGKILFIHKLN